MGYCLAVMAFPSDWLVLPPLDFEAIKLRSAKRIADCLALCGEPAAKRRRASSQLSEHAQVLERNGSSTGTSHQVDACPLQTTDPTSNQAIGDSGRRKNEGKVTINRGERWKRWVDEVLTVAEPGAIIQMAKRVICGDMRKREIRKSNIHSLAMDCCAPKKYKSSREKDSKRKGNYDARVNEHKRQNALFDERPKQFLDTLLGKQASKPVRLEGKAVASHYRNIYRDSDCEVELRKYRRISGGCLEAFTLDEVRRAIKRGNAATGMDGVTRDDIRRWIRRNPVECVSFYNLLLLGRDIPESLKVGKLTLIPKRAGAVKVDEMRPITVLSEIYKVYLQLLSGRVEGLVRANSPKCQLGVGVKAGAALGATIVARAVELTHRNGKSAGIVSLDAARAFDTINRASIASALRGLNIDPHLLECVVATLRDTSLRYRGNNGKVVSIRTERGVPQGSPLSGLLFVLGTSEAVKTIEKSNAPLVVDGAKFSVSVYMDDICIISNSVEGAMRSAVIAKEKLKEVGLRLNVAKTQVVELRRAAKGTKRTTVIESEVMFEDSKVKTLRSKDSLKVLGMTIPVMPRTLKESWDRFERMLVDSLSKVSKAKCSLDRRIQLLRDYLLPRFSFRLSLLKTTSNPNLSRRPRMPSNLDGALDNCLRNVLHLANSQKHRETVKQARLPICMGGFGFHSVESSYWRSRARLAESARRFRGAAFAQVICPDLNTAEKFKERKICERIRRFTEWSSQTGNRWASHRLKIVNVYRGPRNLTGLTGGKLVRFHKLRAGLSNTRDVLRRKCVIRDTVKCRRNCPAPLESMTHILGSCVDRRCHAQYVSRHNRVVNRLGRLIKAADLQWSPEMEVVGTHQGERLKPDVIVATKSATYVLDVGVATETSDGTSFSRVGEAKRRKYESPWLRDELIRRGLAREDKPFYVIPLIVGARGTFLDCLPSLGVKQFCSDLKMSVNRMFSCLAQTAAEGSLLIVDKFLRDE